MKEYNSHKYTLHKLASVTPSLAFSPDADFKVWRAAAKDKLYELLGMGSFQKCDDDFYQKLQYRPHAIGNINHPLVDKSLLSFTCDKCGSSGEQLTEWRYSNQFFRANFRCPNCNYDARVAVRFKKYFDRLETKKNVSIISNEKVKK